MFGETIPGTPVTKYGIHVPIDFKNNKFPRHTYWIIYTTMSHKIPTLLGT